MTIFSPYIYGWSKDDNESFKISSLQDVNDKLHHHLVSLAFVVDGRYPEIESWIPDIKEFDGDVILSFGGADGSYPPDKLNTQEEFERCFNLLVASGVRAIDYDIEGDTLNDKHKVTTIAKIAKLLQTKFTENQEQFYISLTLPIEFSSGLSRAAVNAINIFKNNGVNLKIINAMIMDYYTPLPENGTWGKENIRIISIFHCQVSLIFPHLKPEQIWQMLGICPMIGENDDGTIFSIDDMREVLQFVKEKNIGLVSFWALNRDQVTDPNASTTYDSTRCNSTDFEYSKVVIDMGLNNRLFS